MSTESPFVNGDGTDADASVTHTAPPVEDEAFDDDGVLYDDEVAPEYGILGFTLREILIVGAWLVAFIASFFPYVAGVPIWGSGIDWILPIGVPTVAVFLIVLRRFSPDGIRRVGSLGIDQFASVAFSVAAVFWLGQLWNAIAFSIEFGVFALLWNSLVQLLASLALVVFTVFAPLVPGLKEDFHGRLVTLAHRNANPVRPVIPRPRPEQAPEPATEHAPDSDTAAARNDAAAGTSPVVATAMPVAERTDDAEPLPQPILGGRADASMTTDTRSEVPAGGLRRSPDPVVPADGLDVELSHEQATDEVARLDIAEQVPLASHASGGGTGTEERAADEEYVPTYSRRTWNQEPEIASDTGSIETMLGATAQDVDATETTAFPAVDDVRETSDHGGLAADAQPFWILAPTERDVHDERGNPLFRIGPSAWALVIEDRGGAFVVRHDDGRIGYLHDISDITKG